jgi:hypothetical protein
MEARRLRVKLLFPAWILFVQLMNQEQGALMP